MLRQAYTVYLFIYLFILRHGLTNFKLHPCCKKYIKLMEKETLPALYYKMCEYAQNLGTRLLQ